MKCQHGQKSSCPPKKNWLGLCCARCVCANHHSAPTRLIRRQGYHQQHPIFGVIIVVVGVINVERVPQPQRHPAGGQIADPRPGLGVVCIQSVMVILVRLSRCMGVAVVNADVTDDLAGKIIIGRALYGGVLFKTDIFGAEVVLGQTAQSGEIDRSALEIPSF